MRVTRQAAPIRKQTANNLRAAILDGRFKPGERLNEKELCELTGVSRTSVREALRLLEAENLVTTVPNKGPVVTEMGWQEAQDIYQVREQLEGLVVLLFTERADQKQMKALADEVDNLEKSCQAGDLTQFMQTKNRFYNVLLEGCGNRTAHAILRSLLDRINFLRSTSLSTPSRMAKSVREIKKIVLAIQEGDAAAAQAACREHVRRAAEAALPVLRRQET